MAITIRKNNGFRQKFDFRNVEAPYHVCAENKYAGFEIIRCAYKWMHFEDLSFIWKVIHQDASGVMPYINNCPFCGVDLEKEYQEAGQPITATQTRPWN